VLLFVLLEGVNRTRSSDFAALSDDRTRILRCWLAAAGMTAMGSTLAASLVTHRWAPRYILPIFILPLALSTALLGPQIGTLRPRVIRALQCGMLVVVGVLATDRSKELAPLNLYTPAHACLDRFTYKEGLGAGYAEYWHARPPMVLGKNQLTISAVAGALSPRRWMDNVLWYSRGYGATSARPPVYDFVITNGLDEAWLESRFGAPRTREECFGPEMWVYDRPSDVEFRNYRRTFIARETRDHDGWWESTTLADARSKGQARVGFDGAEGLLIEFAGAEAANVLELSSPTRKTLQVSYQRAAVEVARQAVDFQADARRLLAIPNVVLRTGLDAIHLHGDPHTFYELDDAAVMIDARKESTGRLSDGLRARSRAPEQ
jgi:hypothetical protein